MNELNKEITEVVLGECWHEGSGQHRDSFFGTIEVCVCGDVGCITSNPDFSTCCGYELLRQKMCELREWANFSYWLRFERKLKEACERCWANTESWEQLPYIEKSKLILAYFKAKIFKNETIKNHK